jgi:hypothetical protein
MDCRCRSVTRTGNNGETLVNLVGVTFYTLYKKVTSVYVRMYGVNGSTTMISITNTGACTG